MLQELRSQYKDKYGKNPGWQWDEAKLREMLEVEPGVKTAEEKQKEIDDELQLDSQFGWIETLVTDKLFNEMPPAYKDDGKPYIIIGNDYVPYDKAKKEVFLKVRLYIDRELEKIETEKH